MKSLAQSKANQLENELSLSRSHAKDVESEAAAARKAIEDLKAAIGTQEHDLKIKKIEAVTMGSRLQDDSEKLKKLEDQTHVQQQQLKKAEVSITVETKKEATIQERLEKVQKESQDKYRDLMAIIDQKSKLETKTADQAKQIDQQQKNITNSLARLHEKDQKITETEQAKKDREAALATEQAQLKKSRDELQKVQAEEA